MFQRLKQRLNILIRLSYGQKGQSLVEMMIFTPLLIFLLLGVFEVGAALRSYLTMVNANREITRYSVRPGYLNFAEVDPALSDEQNGRNIYQGVFGWVSTTLSGQLPLDFTEADNDGDGFADGNATLITSHLVADTGLPCENITDPAKADKCICDAFVDAYEAGKSYDKYLEEDLHMHKNDFDPELIFDDIFIHPDKEGYGFQRATFGPKMTVTGEKETRIDPQELIKEMAAYNNKFNCEIIKKGGVPSANNAIVTEMFYDQPQLFGFPFISNPYTDPVPLYSHTTMRLIGAARSLGTAAGNLTDGIDTIGPVCFAYPTTVRRSVIEATSIGTIIDIFDGNGPSDFGWLAWNPAGDDENYINYELNYPQMSFNNYQDPSEPSDFTLNRGDYVTSLTGIANSIDNRTILDNLGRTIDIIIPVWDDLSPDGFKVFDNPNEGPPQTLSAYKVYTFVRVRILEGDGPDGGPAIDLDHTEIWARYLGEDDMCQ